MSKPKLKEALVVEGRYDKNTLSQIVDAVILETRGFGIFKDKELGRLLRFYAATRGLIVLTDSDGAGFLIRNRLKGMLPPDSLKHAYIPDIMGKERRKEVPSKEGKLGVEGMKPQVLLDALRRCGATLEGEENEVPKTHKLTKADFYELGLSGGKGSSVKRGAISQKLGFPERMTADGLLDAINTLLWSGHLDLETLQRYCTNDTDKENC